MTTNSTALPKYKVYIFGQDVTNDVTSINTNHHTGTGPNVCQLQLLNENDKYVMTTADMADLLNIDPNKLKIPWRDKAYAVNQLQSESKPSLKPSFNKKLSEASGANDIKRTIVNAKLAYPDIALDPAQRRGVTGAPPTDLQYYGTSVKRYKFSDGLPIFHPMDPVRIAMRDPYDPTKWYWYFSGFLSDMGDSRDSNNVNILNLTVEDPTKILRYTRVAINPGIVDAQKAIQQLTDLSLRSFRANPFSQFTLSEIIFTLLFGDEAVGTTGLLQGLDPSKKEVNILQTRIRAIGHFSLSNSGQFTFGPRSSPTPGTVDKKPQANRDSQFNERIPNKHIELPQWQALVSHEVRASDIDTMMSSSARVNNKVNVAKARVPKNPDGSVSIEGAIDYICTNVGLYPIDGGRLLILQPDSLGLDNAKILAQDVISQVPLETGFKSVLEIIYELIKQLDFVFYATPKGDIIIEPHMYDFDPDDFGLEDVKLPDLATGQRRTTAIDSLKLVEQDIPSQSNLGGFGLDYYITREFTMSVETALSDEKVYTLAVVPHQIIQGWESIGTTSIIGNMAVVPLVDLIPIYGTRVADISLKSYIATPEAAYYYANICLNRLNADAISLRVNHLPNIRLGLNRPVYVEAKNMIATTKSVSHSITWGQSGDMSTQTGLHAARIWGGEMSSRDRTTPIFSSIGGTGSRPLDYSLLFRLKDPPSQSISPSTNRVGLTTIVPITGDDEGLF